jgi:hypothetical protein
MNNFEIHIAELNGYLQSLRRLRGSGYLYSACSYQATGDIDQFLIETINGWGDDGEFKYEGKTEIEFRVIEERLVKIIFNGVLNLENINVDEFKDNIKKAVIEDINEYYGLASTSLASDGIFHPLIRGPVFEVKIKNKHYSGLFFYLVQIGNYYVLTSFTKRKPSV